MTSISLGMPAAPPPVLAPRRKTRQIQVGKVGVGSESQISVQSMTTTLTSDVNATLQQIAELTASGCDIVRVACPSQDDAEALPEIAQHSQIPVIADIHFQPKYVYAAIDAGCAAVRVNPGNIRAFDDQVKEIARAAKDRGTSIRIGVNAGSLDPALYEQHGGATPEALVASALHELALFEEVGFHDVKISVKASNVPLMVDAYRLLADATDHPLHLGVTEAGPPPQGLIKGTAGIATLLAEGIGDTIRYSLTADPVEEARAGRQLLEALGLRERKGLDLIACPSCGRAEVDVIRVAQEAQAALAERNLPIQVAVMGCVVNGPGEAREADLGIAAGRGKGHLFVKGQVVRVVPEDRMVEALVEEAERLVAEGVEARLAAAEAGAAEEAEQAREELLALQGDDPNASEQRVALIRRR
jgi:(E)-4-hydroxy-3-methylbut-2-enyl-diphosphate synthase